MGKKPPSTVAIRECMARPQRSAQSRYASSPVARHRSSSARMTMPQSRKRAGGREEPSPLGISNENKSVERSNACSIRKRAACNACALGGSPSAQPVPSSVLMK